MSIFERTNLNSLEEGPKRIKKNLNCRDSRANPKAGPHPDIFYRGPRLSFSDFGIGIAQK